MAIGKDPNKRVSKEQESQETYNIQNDQRSSEFSENHTKQHRNSNSNPFDYTDYPQTLPKRRTHKKRRSSQHISISSIFKRNTSKASSTGTTASLAFERTNPGCSIVNIFILRILFWDILISGGDVVTDFLRGIDLMVDYSSNGEVELAPTWKYGLLTIAINWLPGLVAAIHIISMYRHNFKACKTMLAALIATVFYPVLPLFAYIRLMWRRRDSNTNPDVERQDKLNIKEKNESQFVKKDVIPIPDDDNLANLIAAIAGGIEAPIQFILQVYLIFTGVVQNPFHFGWTTTRDIFGNSVKLPNISAFSLLFSSLSMFKTLIALNIVDIHIKDINSCYSIGKVIILSLNHLPYFISSTSFRIASIWLCIMYLHIWSPIPILLFWISMLIIGYSRYRSDNMPLWLISFVSLFLPVCFTNREISSGKYRRKMIELQYYTFKWQNISSAMIFIPFLIIMGVLINGYPSWAYSPDIILKNEDFNIILITTIIMGLLSLTFAVNPNWMTWVNKTCKACGDVISMLEVLDEEEAIKDNYESKAVYSKKHENGAEKIIGKEYIEPKTAPCHNREDSGHEMDEVDDPGPVISQSGKTNETSCYRDPKIIVTKVTVQNIPNETVVIKEKLPIKTSKSQMKIVIALFVGLCFLLFVISPIVVACFLTDLGSSRTAYIYYTDPMEPNKTTITQAMVINSNNLNRRIEGALFEGCQLNDRTLTVSDPVAENSDLSRVLIVDRKNWTECKDFENVENINGIIIVDDEQEGCREGYNDMLQFECYRPSYQTSDITPLRDFGSFPIVLMQRVDANRIRDLKLKKMWERNLGIAVSKDLIPETKYKCDLDSECIKPTGIQGGKDIRGEQYRTIFCYWGNKACAGYHNHQENEHTCVDYDVRSRFCEDQFSSSWYSPPDGIDLPRLDEEKSSLKGKFTGLAEHNIKSCFTSKNIEKCSINGWSNWIVDNIVFNKKKRYCHIPKVCILEETKSLVHDGLGI